MTYWLMKTEPATFSVDDLARRRGRRTVWDGVRNHQVRNLLRDQMQVGDLAYLYHSGTDHPGIHGVMRVVRGAFPDPTQFDPDSPYFDPRSARDAPTWLAVGVQLVERWDGPVTLAMLRGLSGCRTMVALRRGNRLSITPVRASEWRAIESARVRST
jgi:predicted RNA-binding protein with PUA-like domain